MQHLIDYFGNERSPLWDQMESMQEENEQITESLPQLEQQIEDIKNEIVLAKRKTGVVELYNETEAANFAMKTMVNLLSGFAKFELNHELNREQFCAIVMKLSMAPVPPAEGEEVVEGSEPVIEFNQEKHDSTLGIFRRALIDHECPFKGDLNNEAYNEILAALRAFDPAAE